jgi:hypothetical protein
MEESKQIENLLSQLKYIKNTLIKRDKLSDKAFNTNPGTSTPKQIDKANTALNWECMELDKAKTVFARSFKGSCLDVGVGEKEYKPSGFHRYKG